MIWESLIKDPARVEIFTKAVQQLNSVNAFGVLLDIAASRNLPAPSDHPIEFSAQRAAWHDGYVECLRDLFLFRERYMREPGTEKPAPTFGAAEELLKSGEINTDEYNAIVASKHNV